MGMDIKQIQDLIKFVAKSGVNEVSIEEQDFKITIKTNQEPTFVTASVPAVLPQAAPIAAAQPIQQESAPIAAHTPVDNQTDESRYVTIKSPMIGTFYRSSSPDKPSLINIGDEITSGTVLCIIEAMKLFNEIESEVSGKVVKVLVDNSKPVEYDQPLFLIDPS
jgi:acetyl-CoA carboxylase biotin carboxyl carrier protein